MFIAKFSSSFSTASPTFTSTKTTSRPIEEAAHWAGYDDDDDGDDDDGDDNDDDDIIVLVMI